MVKKKIVFGLHILKFIFDIGVTSYYLLLDCTLW